MHADKICVFNLTKFRSILFQFVSDVLFIAGECSKRSSLDRQSQSSTSVDWIDCNLSPQGKGSVSDVITEWTCPCRDMRMMGLGE